MDQRESLAKARSCKKNFRNQWTDIDWSLVPFETLSDRRKKRAVLEAAKFACELCGFNQTRSDGKCVLQVDHIDGNHDNWDRINLRAVCPNCHAVHSEHFMFYGRQHTGDKSRFRKSPRGATG